MKTELNRWRDRPFDRVWTIEELIAAWDRHGPLLTCGMAAGFANVSSARVHQLVRTGRFSKVSVCGQMFLPAEELNEWLKSPRKPGRPRKVPVG